jgi:hypothetical protein
MNANVRVLLAAVAFVGVPGLLAAQTTTVTFDNPSPPGAADSLLNGVYQGIDFGTGQWRWSGPYAANSTNNLYFATQSSTSRTFTFASGPRVLNSVRVYTTNAGTMTLSDGANATITRAVTVGSLQLVTTGWTLASSTITVGFTAGWSLGLDDITSAAAGPVDTIPPLISMTSPQSGATVSGIVNLAADASDNQGVAGVQFFSDGITIGTEDTVAPYSVNWDSTTFANGAHSLTARARDQAGNQTTSATVDVSVDNPVGSGFGYSLSFTGTGTNDIDRVKIRIDDPANALPGPPADIGATDFTLDFWINGNLADNPAAAIQCGANDNWKFGNIVIDRDRYNQDRSYGISFGAGRVAFGVGGDVTGDQTICGTTNVLNGQWHHIAVQRRRSDGLLSLYVDGTLQAQVDGPNGDVSYPDNGVPGNFCGGPCTNSDPFIVLGAEKHDAGPLYPAFTGSFDELRISTSLRYTANFARPTRPFSPDASTVGLYHFDEGQGDHVGDSSGAYGGPSDGVRRYGGTPPAPEWVALTPFTTAPASEVGQWSAPYTWPLVVVHATVLRTGQLLMYDGSTDNNRGGPSATLWNPATGAFTPVPTATDIFCGAHTHLADGRVLVAGGNAAAFVGLADTNIFDPVTSAWSRVDNMVNRRWYPTTITLADGRVLAVSGTSTCYTCEVENPEIYNPATDTWTELEDASLLLALYPHLFLLPDGRILVPASDEDPMATFTLDVDDETWSTVDPRILQGGAAVMYEPGRVMKSGSAADVDLATSPAVNTTYVLDMNQPSPTWRATEPMEFPRAHHYLTILPDGSVLTSGGGRSTDGVNLALAVDEAELWSPVTESWTTMASADVPRLYHSTAILLPDGRVLSAGGGRFVGYPNINQFGAEFFSPPYLFRGARPQITSVPSTVQYGTTFFVGNAAPADIERVTLVAPGAVTHQMNMQQRFLSLEFAETTGGVNVTVPANPNLAPPGHYMLFLINSRGVPSIASFTQVLSSAPTQNPVPTTTGLVPSSAAAGSGGFQLTVNGGNFVNGAEVRWNGVNRVTTFVSANQLTASITSADVASAGSASVTVFNPAPGGGLSNAQTFTISAPPNPLPTTSGLVPSSVMAGSGALQLTVNGSNFVNGSIVRWNGANRTTTFVSANQLTASITSADVTNAGSASVTVFNPAPGGGTSNAQTFTINAAPNPAPATTGLVPSSVAAGSAAFQLTVNGTNFVNGAAVRWNGANRTTTFVSAGQLTASITAADVASAASASVTVFNPAPGGGTSNAQTFTIDAAPNPVPTTTGLVPSSVAAGSAAFQLTVSGTNFVNGAAVRWNGSDRTTTFVSAGQLTAQITAADVGSAGSASVAVFNPTPGGGTSNAQTFTIAISGGPGPGLVAAYGFNAGSGTAASDSSGNNNNGTLTGATWTTSGRFGSALVFNGTNNLVTIADANSLDLTTGMTLEAWVYPTVQPTGWRTIIAKERSGGIAFYLHAGSTSTNRPATGAYIANAERQLFGGTRLTANTWTHLAATYDGAMQRLYINGVQVASRAQTGSIATSTNALRIGGNTVWGEYFQGRIDEVRVYNRALSAAEIQTDMNTAVP